MLCTKALLTPEMRDIGGSPRTRTATYRQPMANRLTYRSILFLYEEYGFINRKDHSE